jgi:hypothetical protein
MRSLRGAWLLVGAAWGSRPGYSEPAIRHGPWTCWACMSGVGAHAAVPAPCLRTGCRKGIFVREGLRPGGIRLSTERRYLENQKVCKEKELIFIDGLLVGAIWNGLLAFRGPAQAPLNGSIRPHAAMGMGLRYNQSTLQLPDTGGSMRDQLEGRGHLKARLLPRRLARKRISLSHSKSRAKAILEVQDCFSPACSATQGDAVLVIALCCVTRASCTQGSA